MVHYCNHLNIMVACIFGALLVGCSSQDAVYQSTSSEDAAAAVAAMEEDISSEETSPFAVESEDNQHTGEPDQEQNPDSLLPGDDKLHWVGFPRWEERPGVLEEPNLYCDDSGGRYWVLRLREEDEPYGGLQQLYIYDSRLERLALLWEFSGSDQIIHPRIVGMDRWNLLLIEEGAILLDGDGRPWPEQPRQEDWTVRYGLATDDGGLLLLGDNDDQKQVIAVFDSAGNLVNRIDTPWASDFYYYINSSMEFRVYGDILVQSPRYSQVLLWTNLADGECRTLEADFVQTEEEWAVSVFRGNADPNSPAIAYLWQEGEISEILELPDVWYYMPGYDALSGENMVHRAEYDGDGGVLRLYQPTTRTTIRLESGSVHQEFLISDGRLAAESPNGLYQAIHVQTGFYALRVKPQETYLKNTMTGEHRLLYQWNWSFADEPLVLTDSLLFRCFENEFYSLDTGEKLYDHLQFAGEPVREDASFGYEIMGFTEVPDMDAYVALRRQEDDSDTMNIAWNISLHSQDGSLMWQWESDLYAETYTGWLGYEYPKVTPVEVWNTRVIFADNGELRYDPDTGLDRQPGVVILDLDTITYRRLAGSRWARSGDTIITAELEKAYDQEQMRVTLFCYQDFEQVGSVTYYLDQELPRDWRLRYLPQENRVELVYLEYQETVLDTVWLSLDGMV